MKQFLTLLAIIFSIAASHVVAATPTKSASDAATPTVKKLNAMDDLKERLATKVAELRQSQKKAIAGIVKAVTISTLTMETKISDVKIELTDSIKIFQTLKDKRTELTIEDVAKSDTIVVFGDYDASLDLMKTKIIVIQNPTPLRASGMITAIDKKEFTITIESPEKQKIDIDIEKFTLVNAFAKSEGISKSGFSKLEVGDTVYISGKADAKLADRISATRILNIGNQSGVTPTPTLDLSPTATASASATSSAKKK